MPRVVWSVLALLLGVSWAVAQTPSQYRTNQRYIFTSGIELPAGGGSELGGGTLRVAYCGELAEAGTIYFGAPDLTVSEPALASAACDALENATEGTADVVLSAGLTLAPRYMRCITDGTLGAAETLAFQLRAATATVAGVTCSLGEAQTVCEVFTPTAPALAVGAATAVRAIEASDNADDNAKCIVLYHVE